MERKNKLFIIALILFILSLGFFIFTIYSKVSYLERKMFFARVIVSNSSGFDLNSTALTFGKIMPGSSSTRNLIMENNYGLPIIVELSSKGDISELLKYTERTWVENNKTEKIAVTATAPQDMEYGTYEGFVIATIRSEK